MIIILVMIALLIGQVELTMFVRSTLDRIEIQRAYDQGRIDGKMEALDHFLVGLKRSFEIDDRTEEE